MTVVVATDFSVLVAVAVVVVTDVAVVVAIIFFVTVVVANLVLVRISVTNSASPESVETVEDSQKVLGTVVVCGVLVTVNVAETVSLAVAVGHSVLGIPVGGEETAQVFVAVSLSVQPLPKVKRFLKT